MLDSDVAMLYHYPTKRINETVNRNKQRFPENFCFKLTDEEYEVLRCKDITLNKDCIQENFDNSLRSQIATLNEKVGRGRFHDRFIVLDNEEMYHLGASIKDVGKKCFGINKIVDMEIIERIINIS